MMYFKGSRVKQNNNEVHETYKGVDVAIFSIENSGSGLNGESVDIFMLSFRIGFQ